MKIKYGPYSPSRLDVANCPYSFLKNYIEKSEERGSHSLPQARGSVVHEIFEEISNAIIEDDSAFFSKEKIREMVIRTVPKYPAAYQESDQIVEMCRKYINTLPDVLYFKDNLSIATEQKLAVSASFSDESGLSFHEADYDDPNAFMRGKADILVIRNEEYEHYLYDDEGNPVLEDSLMPDGTPRLNSRGRPMKEHAYEMRTGFVASIIDHKTQPNIETADTFQMGCYAWLVSKIHPYVDAVKTTLHFARMGSYSQPYIWSKERLEAVEDNICTKIAIIENTLDWVPVPNHLCQYCKIIDKCPEISEFINIDTETGNYSVKPENLKCYGDTMKAIKVAGMLNIFDEVVKKGKENLRKHVKSYGPIAIPGKKYDFYPSVSYDEAKINGKKFREEVIGIFKKHGKDPMHYMEFKKDVFKNINLAANFAGEETALAQELNEILPMKTTTQFRGGKL